MDKSVKNLIKMSFALHNLRSLCRCSSVNFIQKSFCHTLKKETLPTSIYKQLGEEPSEVFTYIDKNQKYLSGQHCIEALQKLKKFSNQFEDINQKGLAQICNELKKRIRTLDASDAIAALGALTKLQVPTNTVIYESLLQIIRSNINSLTIDDVISLQIILRNAQESPLVEAIKIALPIIFEIQLPRIDRSNIDLLAMCLIFATKMESKNEESIRFILDTISSYKNEIPVKSAKFIFNSLSAIPEIAIEYKNVLYRVQNILIDEVSSLSFVDAMMILKSISIIRSKPFYNEHLIDALVNSVIITDDLGYKNGVEALNKLVIIGHDQIPLLDYLATKFFEQPDLIKNADPFDLSLFVSAMAMSDYKPVFWDKIQELILDNKFIPTYNRLTEFVHDLAILDCYSSRLIANVFELNTLTEFMSPDTKSRIVKLYQIVKTLHLGYEGPCPLENRPAEFFDWGQYDSKPFPLLPGLNMALGGSEFVRTKVGTKLGHFIDHVVAFRREDGLPIAINQENSQKANELSNNTGENFEFLNSTQIEGFSSHIAEKDALNNTGNYLSKPITFLEDIPIPEDSQVILFLDIPPEGYAVNTMQLKGSWNCYIKTLEAMKYMVVPICSKKWLKLREKEKIPYIMHAIRLKCAINRNQQ